MHSGLFRCLLFVWLLLGWVAPISAQPRATDPLVVPPDLKEVTLRAGTIFAGKVVSVEPVRVATSEQAASIQITFQVEQGIRGVRTGQIVTFREWAGLWSAGARYRVGQRLMLFLYSPSALGLTSPVGGAAGRLAIDRSGQVVVSDAQFQATRVTPAPLRSDTRHRVPLRDFVRTLRRMEQE